MLARALFDFGGRYGVRDTWADVGQRNESLQGIDDGELEMKLR